MKVKALKKTYYNRRDVLPGETYEMDDREEAQARALEAIGTIKILKGDQPKQQQTRVQTRAMDAEPAKEEPPQSTAVGPMTTDSGLVPGEGTRRIYRRRDLKAEK